MIISWAFCADSAPTAVINTLPSSWISICTPVSSIIFLIVFPPGPITSRILSVGIFILFTRGAYGDNSLFGSLIHSIILLKINSRPRFAWARAAAKISLLRPSTLISIWIAVIPSGVPATLKSISPRASSIPWISVKIV